MNNYIVVGIIITIICIFIMNSDLIKMVMPNISILNGKTFQNKSKMNKRKLINEKFDQSDDSEIDYNINIDSESKKSSKFCDDTEISFDDSSDKSKMYNNKNMNQKFLNNFKKMMLKIKEDKKDNRREKKDNRVNERPQNDIQKMHKLAEELNRKKNNQQNFVRNDQSNKTIDDTNYDLTETISGIIVNELNKM